MRDWFSLQPGSPALAACPNGVDMGALIPGGAFDFRRTAGPNASHERCAHRRCGSLRQRHSGSGIPQRFGLHPLQMAARRRGLERGDAHDDTITLTGLANGPHHVEVTGKRDSGWYQDAADSLPTI